MTELVKHEENGLSREKIELIKQTVAKGATDLELELFLHACKRTGLDPLMKQVYAIKRWNNEDKRETISFQTGIDGYRLIADRTGKYAGSDEPTYMIGAEGFPEVASVTVYKMIDGQRCAFSASARWTEYVQKKRDGAPTSMWVKMPFLMLGKCAEALALRKAFPAELSGVYTHEEMMQADSEPRSSVMENKREAQAKLADLKRDMASAEPPVAEATEAGGQGTASSQPPADPSEDVMVRAAKARRDLATLDVNVKAVNNWYCALDQAVRHEVHDDYKFALKQASGVKA
jgi:phage recombination protein Bet